MLKASHARCRKEKWKTLKACVALKCKTVLDAVEGNAQKRPETPRRCIPFSSFSPSTERPLLPMPSHSWYSIESAYIPTKQTNCVCTFKILLAARISLGLNCYSPESSATFSLWSPSLWAKHENSAWIRYKHSGGEEGGTEQANEKPPSISDDYA